MNNVINNELLTFIDKDYDNFSIEVFYPEGNISFQDFDIVTVDIATKNKFGTKINDDYTKIRLIETDINTGVFRSIRNLLVYEPWPINLSTRALLHYGLTNLRFLTQYMIVIFLTIQKETEHINLQ